MAVLMIDEDNMHQWLPDGIGTMEGLASALHAIRQGVAPQDVGIDVDWWLDGMDTTLMEADVLPDDYDGFDAREFRMALHDTGMRLCGEDGLRWPIDLWHGMGDDTAYGFATIMFQTTLDRPVDPYRLETWTGMDMRTATGGLIGSYQDAEDHWARLQRDAYWRLLGTDKPVQADVFTRAFDWGSHIPLPGDDDWNDWRKELA